MCPRRCARDCGAAIGAPGSAAASPAPFVKLRERGKTPTYGDLVRQYIALNKTEHFKRLPHGRYINFVADFLKAEKGATRKEAAVAWAEVKELNAPKDYASWVRARRKGATGLARNALQHA